MKLLKSASLYLYKKTHLSTLRLFTLFLNLWVLLNSLILSFGCEHFYGTDAYIQRFTFSNLHGFEKIIGILPLWSQLNFSFELYPVLIGLQWTAAVVAIFGRYPVAAQILVAWTTLSLDLHSPAILDGGNNLVHLMLIYLPIATALARAKAIWTTPFYNALFLIMRLQVAVVYLTAGLSKVHGELWSKGVALYYTMGVQEYGQAQLYSFFANFPDVGVFLSYATVAFQVSFAFLIWNRSLRPLILAIGTTFHLGIVFGMGLTSFGFAMCTSYFIFYTNRQARRTLNKISDLTCLNYLHPCYSTHKIENHPLHI